MVKIENQFIIRLEAAFETKDFVVFVMEYCIGGDLFNLLKKVRNMTEKQA